MFIRCVVQVDLGKNGDMNYLWSLSYLRLCGIWNCVHAGGASDEVLTAAVEPELLFFLLHFLGNLDCNGSVFLTQALFLLALSLFLSCTELTQQRA